MVYPHYANDFLTIASSSLDAFISRAVDRVGKYAITVPDDALIADSVSGSISGKAFGIHRTIDQLGATVGSIAFAIFKLWRYRLFFLYLSYPELLQL